MYIKTVESVDWKKELNKLGWYSGLHKLLQTGAFRHTETNEHEISDEIQHAYEELREALSPLSNMENFVAWLNFKAGYQVLKIPINDTLIYWLRINGLILNIELHDRYAGNGVVTFDIHIPYIDKNGTDEEWMALLDEFIGIAHGKYNDKGDFNMEDWLYPVKAPKLSKEDFNDFIRAIEVLEDIANKTNVPVEDIIREYKEGNLE